MSEYLSPTVVTPAIPDCDMTLLERLILGHIFDVDPVEERSYFHEWEGPRDIPEIEVGQLRQAYEASKNVTSVLTDHVGALLALYDASGLRERLTYVEIDVTDPVISWDRILQSIVTRSATIDEIVVTAAWTCSKMHPDAFGGSVTRITSERIQYASTYDMLIELREEDAQASETAP